MYIYIYIYAYICIYSYTPLWLPLFSLLNKSDKFPNFSNLNIAAMG